ncbi:MAG: hypothetical protein DCF30_09180 [Hyphomicrobiales bacterium]|nr:MAG: hypothetical protein DCF30_09180 [Hyphomicrobiales bacterium]
MEVVVLVEFEAGASPARAALLERVGALALSGKAKLSFVGTEAGGPGEPEHDVVAIGMARAAAATSLLERWRTEGVLSEATRTRILRVQPIWSMEPLALISPDAVGRWGGAGRSCMGLACRHGGEDARTPAKAWRPVRRRSRSSRDAAWSDRPRPDGWQHRAPADAGGP